MSTIIIPTAETIRIARDAAQQDELLFTVEQHDAFDGALWIGRTADTGAKTSTVEHLVSPDPFNPGAERCGCEGFASSGYCVHCAVAEMTRELWRQEAEHEEAADGAAFMLACRADRELAHMATYNLRDLAPVPCGVCEGIGSIDAGFGFPQSIDCPRCQGDKKHGADCATCEGKGGWTRHGVFTYADGTQEGDTDTEDCEDCAGTGRTK